MSSENPKKRRNNNLTLSEPGERHNLQIQEAKQTTNKINQQWYTSKHIIIKPVKSKKYIYNKGSLRERHFTWRGKINSKWQWMSHQKPQMPRKNGTTFYKCWNLSTHNLISHENILQEWKGNYNIFRTGKQWNLSQKDETMRSGGRSLNRKGVIKEKILEY